MKKLSLLLVAFTLFFVSCSSDDDGAGITADATSTLPGTWNVTQLTIDNGSVDTGISIGGNSGSINFSVVGKDFDQTLVFNQNNTFTSTGNGYTATLTFNVLGETTVQEQEIDNFFDEGTWALTDNRITFTTSAATNDATIISLTADTLVLELPLDSGVFDSGSFSGIGGISIGSIAVDGTAKVTLTKQ